MIDGEVASRAPAGRLRGRGCASTCPSGARRRAARRGRRRPRCSARAARPRSRRSRSSRPGCRRVEPELPAEDVERAGEAGEHARDRHREEVVARDADAAVAGGLGVEADGAHLVAERRAVEDQPVDDERADARRRSRRGAPGGSGRPRRRAASQPRRCRRTRSSASRRLASGAARRCRRGTTPTQITIQLSMIVVITSWAPTVALRKPAIPASQRPGEHRGDDRTRMSVSSSGRSTRLASSVATRPRRSSPTRYWPWPPMLNSPQRKANATARPVRTSGVPAASSVCWRFVAAATRGRRCSTGTRRARR